MDPDRSGLRLPHHIPGHFQRASVPLLRQSRASAAEASLSAGLRPPKQHVSSGSGATDVNAVSSVRPAAAHHSDLPQPSGPGGEQGLGPVDQQLRLHGDTAHHPPRPRDQRQLSHPLPRGPALLRVPLVPAREVPQQVSNAPLSSPPPPSSVRTLSPLCSFRKNWYLPAPEVSPSSPVEFTLLSKEESSWGTIKMTFRVTG